MLKTILSLILSDSALEKYISYGILLMLAYFLYDFLAFFFIIFICAYIFLQSGENIATRMHDWGEKGRKDTRHKLAAKYATTNIVVTILYVLFISIITLMFVNIMPRIGTDIREFVKHAPTMAHQGQDFISKLEENSGLNIGLQETARNILSPSNFEYVGRFAIDSIKSAGFIFVKFFLGLLFSYIFIIERKKIAIFLKKMRDGNFAFLYDEYARLAGKIGSGFGLIFRAQSLIALINSLMTTLGLIIVSLVHGGGPFPFIITLALIVFIFGFIPVFGTILSGIPIIIIAYTYGGFHAVLSIVIMISIIHILEAYYLNPKIVSSFVHFPVFVTFMILTISEHFFGIVGLLIGVPVTSIIIGLCEDLDQYINSIHRSSLAQKKSGTQA